MTNPTPGHKPARRILCISFSPITTDARVLRQLQVLSEFGDITTAGYGPAPQFSTNHVEISSAAKSLPETLSGVARLALRMHRKVQLTAPAEKACGFCDFLPVCGPNQERRARRKSREQIGDLIELRGRR